MALAQGDLQQTLEQNRLGLMEAAVAFTYVQANTLFSVLKQQRFYSMPGNLFFFLVNIIFSNLL